MTRKNILVLLILIVMLCVPVWGQESPDSLETNYRSFVNAAELKAYMKWWPGKEPLISAHRGGPMSGFPENAVETFENALRYSPCIIECDVRLSKDEKSVLMHDATLDRTTNASGSVSDYTLAQLKTFFLKDPGNKITRYRIPTLGEVLQWARGRAVLMLDLKDAIDYLVVIDKIRKYKTEGHVIIITYNDEQVKTVHRLAPDLMISANTRGVKNVERLFSTGVPAESMCAFVGVYEPDPKVYQLLHQKGISAILGTMHNLDNKAAVRGIRVYQQLFSNGADILSTDNVPLVSKAIKKWKNS